MTSDESWASRLIANVSASISVSPARGCGRVDAKVTEALLEQIQQKKHDLKSDRHHDCRAQSERILRSPSPAWASLFLVVRRWPIRTSKPPVTCHGPESRAAAGASDGFSTISTTTTRRISSTVHAATVPAAASAKEFRLNPRLCLEKLNVTAVDEDQSAQRTGRLISPGISQRVPRDIAHEIDARENQDDHPEPRGLDAAEGAPGPREAAGGPRERARRTAAPPAFHGRSASRRREWFLLAEREHGHGRDTAAGQGEVSGAGQESHAEQ